jgi:hypothetical protein
MLVQHCQGYHKWWQNQEAQNRQSKAIECMREACNDDHDMTLCSACAQQYAQSTKEQLQSGQQAIGICCGFQAITLKYSVVY